MTLTLKLLFILTLLSFNNFHAIGQDTQTIELRGEVRDSLTRQPLAFAHVKIKGKAIGVPANGEGQFSLRLEQQLINDTLLISLLGYASKIVLVRQLVEKGSSTFYLAENSISLNEVVIKAENAENIIKEVSQRLKDNFPTEPYEFSGYYTNAYKEFNTYVKQVEVAFDGFDGNFHQRSAHSVQVLKKRESPDFRRYKWRQTQGNISWQYLWDIRRQHHHFFISKEYQNYHYSIEDIVHYEGEKVYKLKFVLKDTSERIAQSWAYIRSKDYAILEIGGTTRMVNPKKFTLADNLLMAYKGGSVVVKYVAHQGKMYPSYAGSLYEHAVYDGQLVKKGNFDMYEEMIIHQISTPAKHSGKKAFEQSWQVKAADLPPDTLFWKTYNKPLQTALSKAIEKDLATQINASSGNQNQVPVSEYTAEPITVEKLKEDFALLRSSLQEAHPSLYRYTSKQTMDSLFHQTHESLTQPLAEIEFYRRLTPILAQIRCGHTGSMPSQMYWQAHSGRASFLPVQVKYMEGKLYVVKSYNPAATIQPGNELVSINNLSIEKIVEKILPHITADGYITASKYAILAADFTRLYSLYVATADSFTIVNKAKDGQQQSIRVPAISFENYSAWRKEEKTENKYSLLDANTALLKVATFTDKNAQAFKDWVKHSFEDIQANKISNLIIDLRGNEGGRDDYAMYLLSFLAKAPFHYHRSLKAATNYFSFLSHTNQNESFNNQMAEIVHRDSLGNFMLRKSHPTLQLSQPDANAFRGKCYFLINSLTFSAAADFAAIAKDLKLGSFIGEETAGTSEGNTSNGELLLTLPHSGIRIGVPLFQITNALSFKSAKGRGVLPEHAVSYGVEEYVRNSDKGLALVKELISAEAK